MTENKLDQALRAEEELLPSSGFLAAVMERVREEAAAPKPIPFPWKRALPGMIAAAVGLGWAGSELVEHVMPEMRGFTMEQLHISVSALHSPDQSIWIALAVGVAVLSGIASRRFLSSSDVF